ncbi:MAG: sulfatase [Chloroflexi bacterium]|nr:sulfatase [Chloroflexota bacterium]OJV88333.1 MAG: hypothetical protein BGO39_23935 [Chloroflexi bacterium 54-19]
MTQTKRPNVIWVISDQMRAQAMSYIGDPNVRTPNLDRMAWEGMSFTNAVSGAPLCSPFRGALLTGMYPHHSSVPGHDYPLSTEVPTVAHAFRAAGYRTCWVGKWHLDGNREGLDLTQQENIPRFRQIPADRRGGFEDWWAFEYSNEPFRSRIHTDVNGETVSYRMPGYQTDDLTDIFIDWLKDRPKDEPFFGVLSVEQPHTPYIAPAENMAHYNPAGLKLRPNVPDVKWVTERARTELMGYYAAIERVDYNVGRLRAALEELDLDDDTYVIFFADHGDMHGSHGQFWKTAPWEESCRIPFIIRMPGRSFQVMLQNPTLINHVDIAPTTLGICGINKPEGMEGQDYSNQFLDYQPVFDRPMSEQVPPNAPDSVYLSIPVPTYHPDSVDRPWRAIITADGWKYAALEGQPWLMFNLNDDPYELINLAHNTWFRHRRKQLQERLAQWIHDTQDEFKLA